MVRKTNFLLLFTTYCLGCFVDEGMTEMAPKFLQLPLQRSGEATSLNKNGVHQITFTDDLNRRLLQFDKAKSAENASKQELFAYGPLGNFFETVLLVGSEQQTVKLVVDTGSSWTWLTYDKCTEKYAELIKKSNKEDEEIRIERDHKMTIGEVIGRIRIHD